MNPLNVKTAGLIGPKFCRPKEGLWLVKVEKCCPKKVDFISLENVSIKA